jgi:site-specific recombinase XerD
MSTFRHAKHRTKAIVDPELRSSIYPKREEEYVREQRRLREWPGIAHNKELITAYQQFILVKGCQGLRAAKLSGQLRRLSDKLKKPFDTLTKEDLAALVAWINQNNAWTVVTRSDYRRALKTFCNWLEEEDPRLRSSDAVVREEAQRFYQYLRRHVSTRYQKRALDYSTIITDEDARKIIEEGCRNAMERAIVAVLHETGCRVGELLNLRIRDIERKDKYAMLRLDGKTGERRVPIMQCTPYLYQWLADHPFKSNTNALLWVSKHCGFHGHPLNYIGIQRVLSRTMTRAAIRKKHNPHWFRHSRATLLAPQYSEQILCALMGWSLGSKQVRTYVHLGAGQVEDAFRGVNGMKDRAPLAQPVKHCVCGATNGETATYCYRCGNALNVATIIERERRKEADMTFAEKALYEILDDPHAMTRLRELMEEARNKRT